MLDFGSKRCCVIGYKYGQDDFRTTLSWWSAGGRSALGNVAEDNANAIIDHLGLHATRIVAVDMEALQRESVFECRIVWMQREVDLLHVADANIVVCDH